MRTTTHLPSDLLLPLDLGGSCPSSLARVKTSAPSSIMWAGVRSAVGTSFYLVPSFAASLVLIRSSPRSHVLQFCSRFFFFSSSSNNQNVDSVTFGENKKKTECVCTCLIYTQFSNPLGCPTSCEFYVCYTISVVYEPLILNLKQVSDAFLTVSCVCENDPRSHFGLFKFERPRSSKRSKVKVA